MIITIMKLILQEHGIWLRLENDEINARTMPAFLDKFALQDGISANGGWFYTIKLVSWNNENITYTVTKWKRKKGYKNEKFHEFSDEMKREFNLRNDFLKRNKNVDFTEELELQYDEYHDWMQSLFYEINEGTYQNIKDMLQFLNLRFEESFQSGFLPRSKISFWRREISLSQETVINRNTGGSSLRRGLIKF